MAPLASNVMLGYPSWADVGNVYTPTFSLGSWQAALPLTNLQDRRLAKVARSTDALAASTTFDIDLGVARPVRLRAIPKHNISQAGTIRIRSSNAAGNFAAPVYDSGTLNVWPVVYPSGSLNSGRTEEISGGGDGKMTAEDASGFNLGLCIIASVYSSARYERWEIVDTGNAAGYIELARIFIALGYQPTINMSLGAKLGVESQTERFETDGGATIFMERPRRRNLTFAIETLPNDEALANIFDLHRRAGTSKQIMVAYDPTDTAHMHRRSFLATQRDMSPLEQVSYYGMGTPISLVEEL